MPTPRNHELGGSALHFKLVRLPGFVHRSAAILSLGLALFSSGCRKTPPQTSGAEVEATLSPAPKRTEASTEGIATWYAVPPDSLTKRRAGKDELTASHHRLPIGTMVRVTHLANGKSVIVRIIDRLGSSRHPLIDLSREAAEKLDMISEGSARVRLEVLPDEKRVDAVPDSKATAPHP